MDLNWPQLLQDYGPFALLPFAVIVIERLAAKRAHDQNLPESIRNRAYGAAWGLIFILCLAVIAFWFQSRPKEAMMRGKITGLGIRQQLRASGPDTANVRVFTYRDPQEADRLFWRAFSVNPLDDHAELSFYIDTASSGEQIFSYVFPASRAFYDYSTELALSYDPAKNAIAFDNPVTKLHQVLERRPVVITASNAAAPVERLFDRLLWSTVLLAQSAPAKTKLPASAVIANLDSDDTLIRLTARTQLASLGSAATGDMDKALVNVDSSYRVKLGVIVAAIQMPGFKTNAFSPTAWCQVWNATQTGDATLKTQARLLLNKQKTPVNVSKCPTGKSPVQRPSLTQPVVLAPLPEVELLNTGNTASVSNNPPRPPTFEIAKPYVITYVWDYHWNNGKGQAAGHIGLKNERGQVLGPWQAYGSAGQGGAPNVNWEASPNETLPPGRYTVVDTDPETWSWNQQSGGGFSIVKGRPLESSPEPTVHVPVVEASRGKVR